MQLLDHKIQYLVGNQSILEKIQEVPALPLFSDTVMDFFDQLSRRLLAKEMRKYSDIVAYGFWIRRSSLEQQRKRYHDSMQRLGRGVAFHITPSNIPIQFVVSLTYALLSGNASIVRISQKKYPQVDIICRSIQDVIDDMYPQMSKYICIIRYEHDDLVTEELSSICDIRMVWGGDRTIDKIRRLKVNPRCIDLGFANRYSLAVIDSDAYLEKDYDHIARDFYNDTYYSDQNACSSPRLIVWTGNRIGEAKMIFWEKLQKLVNARYQMSDISASDKLLNTALAASAYPGLREIKDNNLLVRLELPELFPDIMEHMGNCGYFLEYSTSKLEELVPVLKKQCQTITFIGAIEDTLRNIIDKYGVRGVDRLVPVGHGMDLSFVWDGIDLPEILSRRISDS